MQPLNKLLAALVLALSSVTLVFEAARNLEYEYALVTSWLLVFGLPLIGCLWPRGHSYIKSLVPEAPVTVTQFCLLLALPLLSFIPGLLLFASHQCGCGGMGYGLWMTLLVLPAGWLGVSGFIYAVNVRSQSWTRWWVVIGPVIWALVGAGLMWFLPQKRAINAFFGFLHGPVYDLWIPLDAGIVWARVSHGLLGIIFLGLATGFLKWQQLMGHTSEKGRRIFFSTLVGLFVGAQIISCTYDSIWHGVSFLNRALPQTSQEKNIELHYLRGSAADEINARQLARDAAFHVEEIQAILGVILVKPIQIYAYSSPDQKKLLFGGGSTDVTDVWTPSVHIELGESPHPTLRHELVHAVASFASWHGIGFHPNMLITEGLAMAMAPVDDFLDFDEISASMIKSGRIGSLEHLVSPFGFWAASGQRSYVVAGSLLRWLREKYGTEAIREIYKGGSVEAVTKVELSQVLGLWSQEIAKKHSENNDLVVERYSRDPGVFGVQCPHTLEDLARSKKSGFLTTIRQPLNWDSARLNEWRLALEPLDHEARWNVDQNEMASLMKQPILDQSQIRDRVQALEKARTWPPRVMEDLDSALLQSDVEHVSGQTEAAANRLAALLNSFTSKNPGKTMRRQVDVRIELDRSPVIDAIKWRRYVAGWGPIPMVPKDAVWIYNYLSSRRIQNPTKAQLGLWQSQLESARISPDIYREWTRLLASSYARLEEWSDAKILYLSLERLSSGEAKLLAAEHVRRMEHFLKAQASQ